MYSYSFVLCVLCICSAQSVSKLNEDVHHANKTSNAGPIIKPNNLTVASEGGTISLPVKPDTSLLKDNFNSLVALDEESPKTKQKSVKPRKGVDMIPPDTTPDLTVPSHSANLTSIPQKLTNTTIEKTPDISPKKIISNSTSETVKPVEIKTVEVKKKPLILSYEALANMPMEQSKIVVAPSIRTMDNSQIPSPNEKPIPKVYPSRANSHPGMIMPIVITILVVPMFAIVGYMALKRGQEAWKNRHYKRMDFLLDGMYND